MDKTTPSSSREQSGRPWMRRWLVAAGVYNLLWGAIMVVAPEWTLRVLGVQATTNEVWPQLWACIGMIVGVYGVGYLVASRDPMRHWPIVLVGLLGKVFGPIGFVDAAASGELPWRMGVTLLTNDLLWWVPFAGILWAAAQASQPAPDGQPVSLREALREVRTSDGEAVGSVTAGGPTLLVLLRHAGCTFCREAIADLAAQRGAIRAAGMRLVVVGLGEETESLRALGDKYGLTDVAWAADPSRKLYRALELRRGTFLQLFGPLVWIRGVLAAMRGHGIGKLEGDGFQMPGAFVIEGERVLRAYRHTSAADRPDYQELACPMS